ncbi:hypothetical protein E4631_05245 [Hymenobacter sp. UV11]|uniref:LGFP repeat-containing protein n=1 Tax=Hymenobacter sp. UV11 TaxID=1849735 RepID=UPI00105C5617|nr:hypothetical protein [Hymenobacter sp. UV11]TDN35787.1 hypothetical protein A8B98_12095 [Hymenobacter sp. UV11]TFZ67393.1 hypothetical protein E4631_05245 [Hymenobacter sp. UV11]
MAKLIVPVAFPKTGSSTIGAAQAGGLVTQLNLLATVLQKRFDELGGARFFGPLEKKDGSTWYFQNGCLCYNSSLKKALELHGEIYKKWRELGGTAWGRPDTDESPCSDGTGRYNHFNHGANTIMWSPQTGAHGVGGDIHKRWAALDWERSYLGYPTSDEVDFPDGGRVSAFQHGGIYWWPDTGALDLNDVSVAYTGLVCFKETGESSGADEPYAVFGVMTPFATGSYRSQTYSSVDSNTSRPDLLEVYRGKPNGISISVLLMEADEGDPAKYQKQITAAIQKVHEAGTLALGFIPVVGVGIAAVLGPLIQKFIPNIGKAINDLFGFGDDIIGTQTITLTGKDMIILAKKTANSTTKNVGFKFATNNLLGQHANYKVYFGIVPV